MSKMILGTVQLGMNYGINNTTGMPSEATANRMLEYAYNHDIKCLDTAHAYGDSERIIGNYIRNNNKVFDIATKLPVDVSDYNLFECYNATCEKLNVYRLSLLYLHRFEQCKNEKLMKAMQQLKCERKIDQIGISLYEPIELIYIIENLSDIVDVVQIPFNMLDNKRWLSKQLFERADEKGISIIVRSVYLQGLFFLNEEKLKTRGKKVYESIMKLQSLAEQNQMTMAQMSLNFVNSFPEVYGYLLGAETVEQLAENICMNKNIQCLSKELLEQIMGISVGIEDEIIDPRKWSV